MGMVLETFPPAVSPNFGTELFLFCEKDGGLLNQVEELKVHPRWLEKGLQAITWGDRTWNLSYLTYFLRLMA